MRKRGQDGTASKVAGSVLIMLVWPAWMIVGAPMAAEIIRAVCSPQGLLVGAAAVAVSAWAWRP